MDQLGSLQEVFKVTTVAVGAPVVVLGWLFFWLISRYYQEDRTRRSPLPAVPEVPGRLPVIGNGLQLREGRPHVTFVDWAKKYGPIFSVKIGTKSIVVLNSKDIAKEALVTRLSSMGGKKLSKSLNITAFNKGMVAMCDYGDFHKTTKRHIIKSVLGPIAQKQYRVHRDAVIDNLVKELHSHVKNNGLQPVNFRNIYRPELFGLGMKEVLGRDVEYVNVEELGRLSRQDIYKIFAQDPVEIALKYIDLRDFFPFLKWIPRRNFERKIEKMVFRRLTLMKALMKEQSQRDASSQEMNCYLKYLLTEGQTLTEEQIAGLLWEALIETSHTSSATAEWAIFELAKNQKLQERLYAEIQSVCGSNQITEENLGQLPLLDAVFHETLRTHPPLPIVPLRYANEDTELGGYHIPAGSEIAINLYGCDMDENQWEKPKEWNPDRFLGNKKYAQSDLFKTMAFGEGKRLCPGALQAAVVVCTSVGRIVQEFEWRLEDGEEKNVEIVGIISEKLHPMRAIIRPRK